MINFKTTANTQALQRAAVIVRNSPGRLREIAEEESAPKILTVVHTEADNGTPEQAPFFTFGSDRSRKYYFFLLNSGAIPFVLIGNARRIYARQQLLTKGWRVKVDARSRGQNGGLIVIDNVAQDRLGRFFPAFVYQKPPGSLSVYRQQPGFFGRWVFNYVYVQRQAKAILSEDITRAFLRDFRGL